MPVFDLSRVAIIAAKILIFSVFLAFFHNFMGEFTTMVGTVLGSIFSSSDTLSSLNLGYFAGAIGLVDFMNTLIASTFMAFNFYVSSMLAIIVFKYSLFVYSMLFRF